MSHKPLVATALAMAILAALPASATSVARMDAADLVDGADLVAVVELVGREIVPSGDGTVPYTFLTFAVDDAVKGEADTPELTLRLLGGEIDGDGLLVAGMPQFETGRRYVLFVRDNGVAACPVFGWGQGSLRFVEDDRTGRVVLADHLGNAIRGIGASGFVLGARVSDPAGGDVEYLRVVRAEEAAEVDVLAGAASIDAPFDADAQTPSAYDVVERLREFVADRSTSPSFRPGRTVVSADPATVPTSIGAR